MLLSVPLAECCMSREGWLSGHCASKAPSAKFCSLAIPARSPPPPPPPSPSYYLFVSSPKRARGTCKVREIVSVLVVLLVVLAVIVCEQNNQLNTERREHSWQHLSHGQHAIQSHS